MKAETIVGIHDNGVNFTPSTHASIAQLATLRHALDVAVADGARVALLFAMGVVIVGACVSLLIPRIAVPDDDDVTVDTLDSLGPVSGTGVQPLGGDRRPGSGGSVARHGVERRWVHDPPADRRVVGGEPEHLRRFRGRPVRERDADAPRGGGLEPESSVEGGAALEDDARLAPVVHELRDPRTRADPMPCRCTAGATARESMAIRRSSRSSSATSDL